MYRYDAVRIDRTSSELIVARAEMSARLFTACYRDRNIRLGDPSTLDSTYIVHLSRLNVRRHRAGQVAQLADIRGGSNVNALPVIVELRECQRKRYECYVKRRTEGSLAAMDGGSPLFMAGFMSSVLCAKRSFPM